MGTCDWEAQRARNAGDRPPGACVLGPLSPRGSSHTSQLRFYELLTDSNSLRVITEVTTCDFLISSTKYLDSNTEVNALLTECGLWLSHTDTEETITARQVSLWPSWFSSLLKRFLT